MDVYRRYGIRVGRDADTGDLLGSAFDALGPEASSEVTLRFFLQDLPYVPGHERRAASGTLLRARPELEAYLYEPLPPLDAPALSNLNGAWVRRTTNRP